MRSPCALLLASCLLTSPAQAQASGGYVPTTGLREWRVSPSGVARMELVGGDSPTAMKAFRIRFLAGFQSDTGAHYHLGTEHIVILKGTLHLGFGTDVDPSKARGYGPGEFIEIPAGTPHFEWMVGEVESHVTHIGPLTAVWLNHRGSFARPSSTVSPARPR